MAVIYRLSCFLVNWLVGGRNVSEPVAELPIVSEKSSNIDVGPEGQGSNPFAAPTAELPSSKVSRKATIPIPSFWKSFLFAFCNICVVFLVGLVFQAVAMVLSSRMLEIPALMWTPGILNLVIAFLLPVCSFTVLGKWMLPTSLLNSFFVSMTFCFLHFVLLVPLAVVWMVFCTT
ncbi:MAG: hypothetical protein R3C03_11285 [Pirellulaceae bacterium]